MVFLQQDPAWRNKKPPSSYFFNGVNLWWSWNVYTTTWDAEPALLQAATDAINNGWKLAVPELRFQYGNDQYPLRLFIRNATCPIQAHIACLPDAYYLWGGGDLWPDPGAWYWYSAKLHVNLAIPGWTPQGMTDAIMHEVGHWIGLHEQYIYPQIGCNNDNANGGLSVMNAADNTTGNCRGIHFPTSQWDIPRTRQYWLGDQLQPPALNDQLHSQTLTRNGLMLTATWKDSEWAEGPHAAVLYYWNQSILQWQPIDATVQTWINIGFHDSSSPEPRTITATWNIQSLPGSPPSNTWYGVLVAGHSFLSQQWITPWKWAQVPPP
jgi:hypothetical protein